MTPTTITTPRARYIAQGAEIAARHGLTWDNIIRPNRIKEFVLARQEIMWYLHRVENLSLSQIGTIMCRDHKTVHSGVLRHSARKAAAHARAALAFEARL